jgi:RNA-directed DNA polymerase
LKPTDWNTVNWRRAQRTVRNLRQRIFRATQAGDHKRVRSLQKLMLRSHANTLMSVRRVTQVNAGKATPGVDKVVVKTPQARGDLVDLLDTAQPWRARPVKRVYIPKADGKRVRPLGMPTILDRCLQARVKNALEPEWEARFEGSSYGFRPGRSCHDALERIFLLACPQKRKKWVLDADLLGAFDNIDQEFLLQALGDFPAKGLIKQWLKAGYLEKGSYHDTPRGTPQGGVVSPLLLNIALHGMEEAIGVKFNSAGTIIGTRAVVRYADDLVVFCESQEDAVAVQQVLTDWLKPRGLMLSEEKTRIVHIHEGFDFLGCQVKQYRYPASKHGYKLLIKPSKAAVKKKRAELREVWLKMRGNSVAAICRQMNPIIRGWTAYYRSKVSSKVFAKMDHWMFQRQKRYANRMHANKTATWKRNRYWGRLNKERQDDWVFGDKKTGQYLLKFSWTKIVRHRLVKGKASPDDPELREYWWERQKLTHTLSREDVLLAEAQDWYCPLCKMDLINGEELHRHHLKPRSEGGTDERGNRALVHLYCHQQIHHRMRQQQPG